MKRSANLDCRTRGRRDTVALMKTKAKPAAAKHPTQKDLLAYAQDFLTAAKRAKTEAHLESCAECQKELVRVKRFLQDVPVALTPKEISTDELMARVKKQLEERKRHRSEEDLFMYEEGFLDSPERAEIDVHVESCADCQRKLESIRRFIPALNKALTPAEQSPKELLAWAKKEMAKEERAKGKPVKSKRQTKA